MNYFLDTNICIYILKGMYPNIIARLKTLAPNQIRVPAIVKAELVYGASKSAHPKKSLSAIEKLIKPFEIIPFTDRATYEYGKIRASLENKGKVIGPNDLIIAATVLAFGGTLVTHNIKEFHRVKSLLCEDWT